MNRFKRVMLAVSLALTVLAFALPASAWWFPLRIAILNEVFTTWSPGETDPNSHITVAASQITFSGLTRSETAYHVSDKGINHFSGDFEHEVTVFINSTTSSSGVSNVWMLANALNNQYAILTANDECLLIRLSKISGTPFLGVLECYNGTQYGGIPSISANTYYYLRIKRYENIGTFGTFFVFVFTDSKRTVLSYVNSLALHEKTDYRYLYGINTYNDSWGESATGFVINLDLREY